MQDAREIERETWSEYFDWLSKELLNAPVSIDVFAPPRAPTVEAQRLSLVGLAYDGVDDVFEVAASHGGPIPNTVRRSIARPEHVFVNSQVMLAPITIAVDAHDGVRTLITIEAGPV